MANIIPNIRSIYLNQEQLKRLKNHKYSVEGTSITEPMMQIFWRWLVERIPLWWAPNAMTLVGLIINILTTAILFVYSPDAKSAVRYLNTYFLLREVYDRTISVLLYKVTSAES